MVCPSFLNILNRIWIISIMVSFHAEMFVTEVFWMNFDEFGGKQRD